MKCLIDNTINQFHDKGKKAEVIKRYIRMRYNINIDLKALKSRLEAYKPSQQTSLANNLITR